MPYRPSPQAIGDLDEIAHFIEIRKGNPVGAAIVSDYLFAAFETVGRDPKTRGGKIRLDVTDKPVKFVIVRKNILIDDDRSDPVRILVVAGIRQDLARLLSEDPRYFS